MPGEFYIEGKKEKATLKDLSSEVAELEAKLHSVVVYRGETTATGAADGSTLICSDLTSRPDYDGNTVVILSGAYIGQARVISGSTTGGTVTPAPTFGGQVVAGVGFAILSIRSGAVDLSPIEDKLDSPVFGLAVLKVLLDALEAKLDVPKPPPYEFWASSPPVIENDVSPNHQLAVGITTITGPPPSIEITEGAISIWRIRQGTATLIVNSQPCSKSDGLIYYDYDFPKATWRKGDQYRALFEGQSIAIGASDYSLPRIYLQGYIGAECRPYVGCATANWNSGTATSGNPGAELVTIGADDTEYKLHSLVVGISSLTDGATVRVRLFMEVNGVEQEVYNQTFLKGTDPNGLWIVNGTVGIHEVLRVELHNDNAADDGKAVSYDYMLEAT